MNHAPLHTARNGAPLSEDALDAALLYAAHDAGIDRANEVTALALHHTYVAHLADCLDDASLRDRILPIGGPGDAIRVVWRA